jgi:hypothetical protein
MAKKSSKKKRPKTFRYKVPKKAKGKTIKVGGKPTARSQFGTITSNLKRP